MEIKIFGEKAKKIADDLDSGYKPVIIGQKVEDIEGRTVVVLTLSKVF